MGASLGQEAMGEVFIHEELIGTAWQPNKQSARALPYGLHT